MTNNDDNFLEPEPINPEKLFNDEEYSTLIVNREGFNKKQNDIADLIESLFEKKLTRAEQEEIYSELKAANAQQILVDAIKSTKNINEQTVLTQACWETGLDFSNHFLFFVSLACQPDNMLCIEAFSAIENIDTKLDNEIISQSISIVANSTSVNPLIKNDLLRHLESRLGE